MTIHAIDKNMQVENVVIEYRDRPEGSESKLNTYADGFKVLKTIVKMFKNYKPLEFFSLIAAVLFVVGMVFFIPVLVHFLEVGTVEKIPDIDRQPVCDPDSYHSAGFPGSSFLHWSISISRILSIRHRW